MTDAMARKRTRDADDAMDTLSDSPNVQGKRSRAHDPHLAIVVEKEAGGEHARRWDTRMKEKWRAWDASLPESSDAPISVWAAAQRKQHDLLS